MVLKISDYALHPPSGSSVPGKVDANPFFNTDPRQLRDMIKVEQDPDRKAKMMSALKQFERQFDGYGYPWRSTRAVRIVLKYRKKMAEIMNPAINMPMYQDVETDQGQEEIIDSLMGLYDNDNNEKVNITRQGIRPKRDIDTAEGNFVNPLEPPMGDVVKERGEGPDPEGMEVLFPPTGGDIDTF